MPSIYLQSQDYATYGLPDTTSEAQVIAASNIIDGYLARKKGVIYAPDGNGNPCYMVAANPDITLTSTTTLSPGQNVNVTVSGGYQTVKVSDVVILDRGDPEITESCAVLAVTQNVLMLDKVLFNHDVGATLDLGLVTTEYRNTPPDRNIINVMETPTLRLLAGWGQYGYCRRGDNIDYTGAMYNSPAIIFSYAGGPPIYENFNTDPTSVYIESNTGALYYPTGIYLAMYSKIKVDYIAGWTYATLPSAIKQACANIVNAQNSLGGISGPIRAFKQGDTSIIRFGGGSGGSSSGNAVTLIDADTANMLKQFRARTVGI